MPKYTRFTVQYVQDGETYVERFSCAREAKTWAEMLRDMAHEWKLTKIRLVRY